MLTYYVAMDGAESVGQMPDVRGGHSKVKPQKPKVQNKANSRSTRLSFGVFREHVREHHFQEDRRFLVAPAGITEHLQFGLFRRKFCCSRTFERFPSFWTIFHHSLSPMNIPIRIASWHVISLAHLSL